MKVLLFIFLFASMHSLAQNDQNNDKLPTDAEMKEMMAEMEKSMNELTPEERKQMEEMGVKLPDLKKMQEMAKTAANAPAHSEVLVPTRDAARIASIPKGSLSKSALPGYLQTIQRRIDTKVDNKTKMKAEATYRWIKSQYKSPGAVANAGVGCWAFGKPGAALILMSKACADDPTNTDHLNNYAAMLTMSDGEDLALPILQYLNRQHPKNSTILNNIAHAWFGLGEITKASQYVDSTLKLCAWHPQANSIKARILETKGKKSEAVKAHKESISRMYSGEKQDHLNDMDYKLKSGDIVWNQPLKNDALGLSTFRCPAFPRSVQTSEELKPAWEAFRRECQSSIDRLQAQYQIAETAAAEKTQRRMKEIMNSPQLAASGDPLLPPVAPKAFVKLHHPMNANSSTQIALAKRQRWLEAAKSIEDIRKAYFNELALLDKAYEKRFGEGKENPFTDFCGARKKIQDNFLNTTNTILETAFLDYIKALRLAINDELYFALNTESEEKYEATVLRQKFTWLGALRNAAVEFQDGAHPACRKIEVKPAVAGPLPEFEDANCAYKSKLNFIFGTITSECSRLKAELHSDVVNMGWETKMSDRDGAGFLDEFQRCTIEVGYSKDVSVGQGPLKLEGEANVSAFVEIDRNGVSDAGVKVTAEVKAKSSVVDTKIKTEAIEMNVGPKNPSINFGGVEAKISINSGFTAGRTGMLKNL